MKNKLALQFRSKLFCFGIFSALSKTRAQSTSEFSRVLDKTVFEGGYLHVSHLTELKI